MTPRACEDLPFERELPVVVAAVTRARAVGHTALPVVRVLARQLALEAVELYLLTHGKREQRHLDGG